MLSKKWIFVLFICGCFSPLCRAISLPSPSAPLEAYACDNCSITEAENLARLQAHINTCSIWENGSPATFCEPVSKHVIILSIATRTAFKFTVTTSINSQNVPVVSTSSFPLSSTEFSLTSDFFDFYADLTDAVIDAQDTLDAQQIVVEGLPSLKAINVYNATLNSCENHPSNYFKNIGNERDIKNELVNLVKERMHGATWAEFTHETFAGGGSISVSKGVDLHYIQNKLSVSKEYGPQNYLVFNIYGQGNISSGGGSGEKIKLDLRLNKNFSRIDGFSVESLFPSGNVEVVDLTDGLVSNCLRELLDQNSEPTTTPPGANMGSGTFSDPYTGDDGTHNPGSYCIKRSVVTTRSTTEDGVVTETTTTFSWIGMCDTFG